MQIVNGSIITPDAVLTDHTLVIEGRTIQAIVPSESAPADPLVIDARGLWIAPGFIDVHVHGSDNHDTMDATPEAIHGMGRFFARHGVTGYFPTTMSAPAEAIARAIENVAACPQPEDGAQHLGVHVEGPYLSKDFPGAQPPDVLRLPDPGEYAQWFESGVVKLITIAPELHDALGLIDEGINRRIEFAIGHSGASYEQVLKAADHGVRQATHTFNGMLGLHHRNPGTLGGVLTDDRIYAQIIGDGIHTHPAMVKLLVRAKGTGRTILITDAIRATGLPDGDYDLGGQPVTVRDGVCRIANGSLAGSTATLDGVLRNVMHFAGLTLPEAIPMATSVPAKAMHLAGKKGALQPGADADLVLLDDDVQVHLTMVGGRVVYQADNP
ncbi:MAG: N-acetylglucosamine-6-phosphate deacetylase [Anaerolineae bacterium]|nr:N-acetylglucosamine-6-phosphate deacetylase [Anaerolineae bacterium]